MRLKSLWMALALSAVLPSTAAMQAARLSRLYSSSRCGHHSSSRCGHHSSSRCGHRIACCSEAIGDEARESRESAAEEEEEATVYTRKKGGYLKRPVDNRDRLPYELTDVTPPERRIGTFKLAANLGCGDSETPQTHINTHIHTRHPSIPSHYPHDSSDACLRLVPQWWRRPRTRS